MLTSYSNKVASSQIGCGCWIQPTSKKATVALVITDKESFHPFIKSNIIHKLSYDYQCPFLIWNIPSFGQMVGSNHLCCLLFFTSGIM